MQRPQIGVGSYAYGLGWFLSEAEGGRLIEHTGSAAGFQSALVLAPDEGVAFAALTNSSRGIAPIHELREHLGLLSRELPEQPLPPNEVGSLAGRYEGPGLELEVLPEDGRLRVGFAELEPFSGERRVFPSFLARSIGGREFEIEHGEWRGQRFDFPRDGFVCFSSLAARVE
jgi:hypothetical protein